MDLIKKPGSSLHAQTVKKDSEEKCFCKTLNWINKE